MLAESNFTGNLLESSVFNAAELSQVECRTASRQAATIRTIADSSATIFEISNPPATYSTNPTPNAVSGPLSQQQQSSGPIIGGVVGAAALVCILVAMGIWFRRKRVKSLPTSGTDTPSNFGSDVEAGNTFPPSSVPPPSAYLLGAEKKEAVAAAFDEFLVARQGSPVPGKAPPLGHLEVLPREGHQAQSQDRKIESLASLKAAMRESEAFVARNSVTAVNETKGLDCVSKEPFEKQTSAPSRAHFEFATSSNESHVNSSHRIAVPEDPNDWTKEEVAQWIVESFGDANLSSLALKQKINGRVLLMLERHEIKSELGLEAFGELRLFEEAVSELRRKSAQQSAQAQESPPSYE
ncbi:hypothetical protein HDU78_007746 [Chytriomyces hyalinus]|nr:hypothetical protein HDU78_007746 [Chytriomyces hyalinus]